MAEMRRWLVLIGLGFVLISCSANPTVTPVSSSSTVLATSSPITTPATQATSTTLTVTQPRFVKFKCDQVVAAFRAAGLEVEKPHAMTRQDYGLAPLLASEGIRFAISSLGSENGGYIMSFSSQADLDKTKEYYLEASMQSVNIYYWVFSRDNILLQIYGNSPDHKKANKYKTALNALK